MGTKKSPQRRLGLGLDALLGSSETKEQLHEVEIAQICTNREQPRKHFDANALDDLKRSIIENGVLQPILVRPIEEGGYQIVAGERRWRAAQLAGKSKIPAVIQRLDDQKGVIASLVENIQRADLNVVELATGMQMLAHRFDLSHQQIASKLGYSRPKVTNLLRILQSDRLVQDALIEHSIEMAHARCLLVLSKPQQRSLLADIIKNQLNVRQTEEKVQSLLKENKPHTQIAKNDKLEYAYQSEHIALYLGARVEVLSRSRGKGKIIIHFNSDEEYQGILEKLT